MKWIVAIGMLFVVACGGGTSAAARREGPDVVTAEWTAGDDAPLTTPAP